MYHLIRIGCFDDVKKMFYRSTADAFRKICQYTKLHQCLKQFWFRHCDSKIAEKKIQLKTKKTKMKKNDMWIKRENKNKKFHKSFDDCRQSSSSTKHNKKRKSQKIMNKSKKECYVCKKIEWLQSRVSDRKKCLTRS